MRIIENSDGRSKQTFIMSKFTINFLSEGLVKKFKICTHASLIVHVDFRKGWHLDPPLDRINPVFEDTRADICHFNKLHNALRGHDA